MPELVQKYLGSVVPYTDNFFATLNSAVFTDGSFAYIPKGVRCPMELSTYFRINAEKTGQFERTLMIADEGAYVSYLEGCTAPQRDENQLHAAVVELVTLDDAEIKYSTVQNWYPGDEEGQVVEFIISSPNAVHAGGETRRFPGPKWKPARRSPGSTQVVILQGDNSVGEFYSIAITNNLPAGRHRHQDDSPWQKHHARRIISKGISAGRSDQHLPRFGQDGAESATGARNYTQCDSLLDRRFLRCAHGALHRESRIATADCRTRSNDIEDQ